MSSIVAVAIYVVLSHPRAEYTRRPVATTLYDLLLRDENLSSDSLLGKFLDYVAGRGLTLYPVQEEAVLELFEEKNVILNSPTGSGKSLVAAASTGAVSRRAVSGSANRV
jgi:superfamily II DNA or RNA helicase